jgi:uncharacterized membrane protein YkvI
MSYHLWIKIAKIAAIYAGTIMGAGFASGQELTQFFVVYGNMGIVGLLLTMVLFAWLGITILEISYTIKATSYHQLLYYICGKKMGTILDGVITIFLFGVLTVMLAGGGTLFRDTLHLPYSLGIALMAFSLVITTLYGINGIATANLIITPLLTVITTYIGMYSLNYHEWDLAMIHIPATAGDMTASHWLLSSLLYLSYNLVMSTTVLVPLGSHTSQRSVRVIGSLIGSLLLLLLAGVIVMVVMVHYPLSPEYEIPMLYIAGSQHIIHHVAYSFIFVAAMYTTGLASLYGCSTKLAAVTGCSRTTALFIFIILSIFFSYIGFTSLISIIFPLFGYATLWFIVRLLYFSFFPK